MLNKDELRPIAIIDSGIGGITVYKRLSKVLNNEKYIYFADSKNFPYGNLQHDRLLEILSEICTTLIKTYNVKAIILACNTATTNCLNELSQMFDCELFGIEPFSCVKDKKNTLIISTALTAKSCKDKELNIISIPKLAGVIEKHILDTDKLKILIKKQLAKPKIQKHKNIVLGCTHYQLVFSIFRSVYPYINFIDPSLYAVKNIARQLKNKKLVNKKKQKHNIMLLGSGNEKELNKIEQLIRR